MKSLLWLVPSVHHFVGVLFSLLFFHFLLFLEKGDVLFQRTRSYLTCRLSGRHRRDEWVARVMNVIHSVSADLYFTSAPTQAPQSAHFSCFNFAPPR
jgi:hypothetical protein